MKEKLVSFSNETRANIKTMAKCENNQTSEIKT